MHYKVLTSVLISLVVFSSLLSNTAFHSNKIFSNTKDSTYYSDIYFQKEETLKSAAGTKSVIFNATGTRLYAMNLEGLSIFEFDRDAKKIRRQFKFKAHKGIGWDYQTKMPVPSWQEKPVEACFTHDDKILWVSLHNAEGIVPIKIEEDFHCPISWDTSLVKTISVVNNDGSCYKIDAPLIKTGLTPKVIAAVNQSSLLVSNWHSKTVSVLSVDNNRFPFGQNIKTIPVQAIPRGICVDDKIGKSFVAIMGSNTIAMIDNKNWKIDKYIKVSANPRHIVLGEDNKMFVSFNSLNQVACINTQTGATLFSIPTHLNPRSIALSKNKKFLFVTCYNGNTIDVLKITNNSFVPIYSLNCPGKPVGIDLYEDKEKIEAWVCNYVGGNIKVLTFTKK